MTARDGSSVNAHVAVYGGICLYMHRHEWVEHGVKRWPNGDVDPTFRCARCGDVICTPGIEVTR